MCCIMDGCWESIALPGHIVAYQPLASSSLKDLNTCCLRVVPLFG